MSEVYGFSNSCNLKEADAYYCGKCQKYNFTFLWEKKAKVKKLTG